MTAPSTTKGNAMAEWAQTVQRDSDRITRRLPVPGGWNHGSIMGQLIAFVPQEPQP